MELVESGVFVESVSKESEANEEGSGADEEKCSLRAGVEVHGKSSSGGEDAECDEDEGEF